MLTLVNCACCLLTLAMHLSARVRAEPAVARFEAIEARKVTIRSANGMPALILADREHLPGNWFDGKEYPKAWTGRDTYAGMIFFSEAGDEVGGLVYSTTRNAGGGSGTGHLSLDQYKQNQVVAMQYLDNGRTLRAGFRVWDRPRDIPLSRQFELMELIQRSGGARKEALVKERAALFEGGIGGSERLFMGSLDRVAQIQIRDTKGRIRIRLFVDERDSARLEFLDEAGRVTSTYPPSQDEDPLH